MSTASHLLLLNAVAGTQRVAEAYEAALAQRYPVREMT